MSRVCNPNADESNFHIFHILLHQAPSQLKEELKLDLTQKYEVKLDVESWLNIYV